MCFAKHGHKWPFWPERARKKRAAFPSGGPPLEKETNAGHFIQQKIFLNKNAWNKNTVNRKTVNGKTMN
jgi:hypothetical protein